MKPSSNLNHSDTSNRVETLRHHGPLGGDYLRLAIYVGVATALLSPASAVAYIGPGAGFAFLGSTLVFIVTISMALATIMFWPLQWAWRKLRRKGISKHARTRRVVIVGLDGLEPTLTERYMSEGLLPNLSQLKESGGYARLRTTLPALSPVAWSSFQTGVNPGAHNIFDFLTRDKRYCLPQLASTETTTQERVTNILGLRWKRRKTSVSITRKSQPFWKILGNHGVFSNIIRVPISYPPEKFNGNILSAMCTPDLKGSQGSFSYFREPSVSEDFKTPHDPSRSSSTSINSTSKSDAQVTGGESRYFERRGDCLHGDLQGPPKPDGTGAMLLPFKLKTDQQPNIQRAILEIDAQTIELIPNQFSPWIELTFSAGRTKVSGIARFCIRTFSEELGSCQKISLYISPVNIHPEKPALPISEPAIFSGWLAKKNGLYGTLGLMEDTWGRNELALDDERFLEQTYLTHNEREKMFFEALSKTREGLCACVFDASDRIQHMFWRYIDDKHPSPVDDRQKFGDTIRQMYIKMDELIGKVQKELNPKDHLFVLSDHGFASFRRCVNLNTWLLQEGYLTLKEGKTTGRDYFQDVDWSRTKAFAVGLSGIYINRTGREIHGTVDSSEAKKLKQEIATKLESLRDPLDASQAIRKVYDAATSYRGLYTEEAPDLIVGYNPGYRVSWDSITGTVEQELFSDNLKAWSGDHHVDPELVPGILFSNQRITKDSPHITDLAPTVLSLFAITPPAYMEGNSVL